jgi:hypothetical protein
MQDRARIRLDPTRVSLLAGADPPATVEVEVTNTSELVDQFDVSILGAPADWYDVKPDRLSLFPKEAGKARVFLHPPRRHDVHAGSFELTVSIRSRDLDAVAATGRISLQIEPSGGFEAQLVKAEDRSDSGSFVLRIANLSDGAITLEVAASDAAQRLAFELPFAVTSLQPYQDIDSIAFSARPRAGIDPPPAGAAIDFKVEVTPQFSDPARAAAARVTLAGRFTYEPSKHQDDRASARLPWRVALAVIPVAAVTHLGLETAFDKINWLTPPGLLGFALLYATTAVAVLASRANAGALPWLLLLGGLPLFIGAAIATAANDPFWLIPAVVLVGAIVLGVRDNFKRRRRTSDAAPG